MENAQREMGLCGVWARFVSGTCTMIAEIYFTCQLLLWYSSNHLWKSGKRQWIVGSEWLVAQGESEGHMEAKGRNSGVAGACEAHDLLRGWKGFLLWCVPICAVIVGISWPKGRPWLWIAAFLVMGIACLANARRCGRLHCYLTGPLFLLAAAYVVLAEFRLVPMRAVVFVDVVSALAVLGCLAEVPFGRYRRGA